MSEKVPAKLLKVGLGDSVIVTTRQKIGGQNEHAAIVTRVESDEIVSVMMLPADGQPYSVASVSHARHSPEAAMTWRQRSRDRSS